QLDLKVFGLVNMTDHQLWVQDFKRRSELSNVSCSEHRLIFDFHSDFPVKCFMHLLESHLLKVQNNICNVFNYTFYGRKLMHYTRNLDGSDGITFQGRKQNSSQGVTDCNSIAFFEWFECE